MQILSTAFWRRLDGLGHDACRLERHGDAWQLDGAAVFKHSNGQPARLDYRVQCDKHWHTRWGRVRGWIGSAAVDFSIARNAQGEWMLNDEVVHGLAHCIDLDLGFTPATNLVTLRRLQLKVGEKSDAPAVWLDLDGDMVSMLDQHYERRTDTDVWYEAPRFDYKALLRTSAEGFVTHYPKLWECEP